MFGCVVHTLVLARGALFVHFSTCCDGFEAEGHQLDDRCCETDSRDWVHRPEIMDDGERLVVLNIIGQSGFGTRLSPGVCKTRHCTAE